MKYGRLACLGLLMCFLATPALAQKEAKASKFLKFRETGDNEGVLEAAIATYQNDDGVTVDLISAVHIGDAKYYARLNQLFKKYDSVLYEMVKPKDADPARRSGGALSMIQRMMKDALDLEFQLDIVDYAAKNFVHADMDPKTFFAEQRKNGESMFKMLFKSVLKQWTNQLDTKTRRKQMSGMDILRALMADDSTRQLKYIFAREMEHADELLESLGGKDGSVIINGRNKVAMKVLSKQMAAGQKKLAIFYGGGHMPDLEKRLAADHGMKRTALRWLPAWDIRSEETRKKEAGKSKRDI